MKNSSQLLAQVTLNTFLKGQEIAIFMMPQKDIHAYIRVYGL